MNWQSELPYLQCIGCSANLKGQGGSGLECSSCGRMYPFRGPILDAGAPEGGINRVTADFYDSDRWVRFRTWEKLFWFLVGGEEQGRSEIIGHLPDLSGTRLLEVGIGDGANIPFIPASCEIYGNDISIAQLSACHERHGARRVRLLLGQAEALPFHDATFDNVLSVGGFNYFSDPARSLREMTRVVRPGGTVVVADETPRLGIRMLKFPLGRRLLGRMLGREFSDLVEQRLDMKLQPVVGDLLEETVIHRVWRKMGYCIVGRAPV